MKIEKVVIEKSCKISELKPGDFFIFNYDNDLHPVYILCDKNCDLLKSIKKFCCLNIDSGILMVSDEHHVIKVTINQN